MTWDSEHERRQRQLERDAETRARRVQAPAEFNPEPPSEFAPRRVVVSPDWDKDSSQWRKAGSLFDQPRLIINVHGVSYEIVPSMMKISKKKSKRVVYRVECMDERAGVGRMFGAVRFVKFDGTETYESNYFFLTVSEAMRAAGLHSKKYADKLKRGRYSGESLSARPGSKHVGKSTIVGSFTYGRYKK